ncbi:MFS transporter [Tersicoccus solisilvae]|uniref:MFS transporter n=1 Tax=Tersicoccus solisilvae TaxID=1882339 RepID=A0ABQ1NV25_9MICC|nr:MFS transporter [Tersicoccus solisilvae]GGC85725.1 MFS transporter [Tersicoccus solisilvae]
MPSARSLSAPATPPAPLRRARLAVAALFLTNGALFANLIPRYPGIKSTLGADNAVYGLAIAAFPTGAIVAGLAAAPIIRRLGSARTAVVGTVLTAVGTVAAASAPSLAAFAVTLFLAGAADAVTDVGQNTHGLRVQRRYGRSIINSFHAIWSIGAVIGGSMAAGAIALGLPAPVHLAISATLFSVVAIVALRFCLPGRDTDPAPGNGTGLAGERTVRPSPRLVLIVAALVLIAMAGTLVEDAGSTWGAVYLSADLGAPAAIAAAGFVALVGAQFVGRLLGDRMVDRFGQRAVARTGGAVTLVGMGVALLVPTVPGTIAGFAAAGLGVATLVPAAMHEADELPGLRAGTGLTVVSWLMRLGFLVSPPVVGLVADHVSLRAGLLVVPLAGLLALLLAGALGGRRHAAVETEPARA